MALENTPPAESRERRQISLNVIQDNAAYEDSDLKPAIEYIEKNWKQFAITIVAALAMVYAVKVFRETRAMNMKASADRYARVNQSYNALLTSVLSANDTKKDAKEGEKTATRDEKIASAKARLEEDLRSLEDTKDPYPAIAKIYRASTLALTGDAAAIKGAVEGLNLSAALASTGPERLYTELSALALGRALLDGNDSYKDGWALLLKLLNQGSYVNVSAASALARIASTPEEKAEVIAAAEKYLLAHPDQNELLEQDIDRLR